MTKNPLNSPFWVVLPYNPQNLQPGSTRGSQYLVLQTRTAQPDGVVERVKTGVPLFYSKPEAFEEAKRQALQSRDIPVVLEVIAFVELPQDVKMITKTFNEDGEIRAEQS